MHAARKSPIAAAHVLTGLAAAAAWAAALPGCDKGDGGPAGECVAEICGDGIDNDCDGSMDCWDYDCGYQGPAEYSCAGRP